jgi:hypothetical protein
MLRFIFALILLLAFAAPSLAEDTLKPGDIVSGRLRFFQSQHQNGTWIKVYQIASDKPMPFATPDEFCPDDHPPKTFHIMLPDDKAQLAQLKRSVGKKIAVVAKQFFCSETAWHIGDAVISDWTFAAPK